MNNRKFNNTDRLNNEEVRTEGNNVELNAAIELELEMFLESEGKLGASQPTPYLTKNKKRAQRRHRNKAASSQQIKLLTEVVGDVSASRVEPGRFRKKSALGCDNPKCNNCTSARKNPSISGMSKLTKQEQVSQLALKADSLVEEVEDSSVAYNEDL